MDAELKACSFLERLTNEFSDADVDYQCSAGVHEFVVRHAGSRFKIEFSDPSLLRTSERDLEQTVGQMVARIRAHGQLASTPAAKAAA
jgi:hypothetical protein